MKRSPDPIPRFLSVRSIAERLDFSPYTVRQWLREGVISRDGVVVIAGEQRIPQENVVAFLEQRYATAAQDLARLLLVDSSENLGVNLQRSDATASPHRSVGAATASAGTS